MPYVVYLTWVKHPNGCVDNSFHGHVPENIAK